MSPVTVSVIVFACVFGGALVGIFVSSRLPSHHVTSETKDVVRLGMGLVATTVALALGLLIASAKSYYDTQSAEVTQLAANVVLLDRILVHYGPETQEARALLRDSVAHAVDFLSAANAGNAHMALGGPNAEGLFDRIQELSPKTDGQRSMQSQAFGLAIQMGQTRWLMFAQTNVSVPMPLLEIMVFWLTVLFISFGLFAPHNGTVVTSLFISTLAVSGAIFLILEMYQPYTGLIRVSAAPLRAALLQLSR
ncbi:MAG: hypothetical protein ACLPND_22710 [Candidatus Korobacteraceae bacterium]